MSDRRLYLDACPGEQRGVATRDGRPERLLIDREDDPAPRLGQVWTAVVEPAPGDARQVGIALGGDRRGRLRAGAAPLPSAGARVEAEVVSEPRADKGAVFRLRGPGSGPLGLLHAGPSLRARLQAFAPEAPIVTGGAAREAADIAEEEALATHHALKGGLLLTVEPTRALVAIDVDHVAGEGLSPSKRLEANLRAIRQAARLMRLKALGGACVIDLIGFPKPGGLIAAEAERAFDAEGVALLPVNRLGLLALSMPHAAQPVHERLGGPGGLASARTQALRLVRALERAGAGDPQAPRVIAHCAPEVAGLLAPLATRLGPRFGVMARLGDPGEPPDIVSR